MLFLLPSPIYWFKFSRAYIKPEPNQFTSALFRLNIIVHNASEEMKMGGM